MFVKLLSNLSTTKRRAFVSPNELSNLGFANGSFILLSSSSSSSRTGPGKETEKIAVVSVWSNPQVPPKSIWLDPLAMLNGGFLTDDLVDLSQLPFPPSPPAKVLDLLVQTPQQPLDMPPELLSLYLAQFCLVKLGELVDIAFRGLLYRVKVIGINEEKVCGIYAVSNTTRCRVRNPPHRPKKDASLDDVGGLGQIKQHLLKLVQIGLYQSTEFTKYGILLHGPSGVGKSLIAKSLAYGTPGVTVWEITPSSLISPYYGESEQKLRHLFQQAQAESPSIVLIDDIHVLCPKRELSSLEMDQRIVATFLTLLDGSDPVKNVLIIATTSFPDALDPALRRPGRLEYEVEIPIPSKQDRQEILQVLLKDSPWLFPSAIPSIAFNAHGYVGADLAALCREAYLHALTITAKDNQGFALLLDEQYLEYALKHTKPSALRQLTVQVPNTKWSDIGGQAELKQLLIEAVEWSLLYPDAFKRMGINPPKGVLMYGPPGCSKTLLAKALATECKMNFLAVKGPELLNKWVGESEKAVKEVFKKARNSAPCVIFFDEIDSIAAARGSSDLSVGDRVLSQLLNEMDGIESIKQVTIIAATNRPDILASLFPWFDKAVFVGLPDYPARLDIFKIHTRFMAVEKDLDFPNLALKTEGFSGAEIAGLCQEAALIAMEKDLDAHFVPFYPTSLVTTLSVG